MDKREKTLFQYQIGAGTRGSKMEVKMAVGEVLIKEAGERRD